MAGAASCITITLEVSTVETANLFFVLVLLVCVGMHLFFGDGHGGHAHGTSGDSGLGQDGDAPPKKTRSLAGSPESEAGGDVQDFRAAAKKEGTQNVECTGLGLVARDLHNHLIRPLRDLGAHHAGIRSHA